MNFERDYSWSGVNYTEPPGLPTIGTTPSACLTRLKKGGFVDPTKVQFPVAHRDFGNRWCKKSAIIPTAYDNIPVSLSFNPTTTHFMDLANKHKLFPEKSPLPGYFAHIPPSPTTSFYTYGHGRWPLPGEPSNIPVSTAFTPSSIGKLSRVNPGYPSYLRSSNDFPPPAPVAPHREVWSSQANRFTGSVPLKNMKKTGPPYRKQYVPLYEDDVFNRRHRPDTAFAKQVKFSNTQPQWTDSI